MSGFTSNLSRSKSLRYSMARGLGGREGSGRDEDIAAGSCCLSVLKAHNNRLRLLHRQRNNNVPNCLNYCFFELKGFPFYHLKLAEGKKERK